MIALPSIAFGGFSGSAKGVTARFQNGRSILSIKTRPTGTSSAAQIARRTSLKTVTKTWRTLTDQQRSCWERLAEKSFGKGAFGQKARISGMNMFVRLNVNRQMVGENMLADAPADGAAVPAVEYSQVIVTPQVVAFNGIKHVLAPNKLVVKMSAPQSAGIGSGWSRTVIISPCVEDDWGEADVTRFYLKTIGVNPTPGAKVFIESFWMDTSTGFTGQVFKDMAVVTNDSSYKPRMRMTTDNLAPLEEQHVSELDVDYSTAAPAVFFDTICLGHGNTASSEVILDGELPDECIANCMVLARGLGDDGSLHPQSFEVQARNTSGKARLLFMHRGGNYVKPSEVFGPGISYKQ